MQYPHAYRHVDAAILGRRSVRAFLPTPVPRQVVDDILSVARFAPSGTNTQPWKVYALTGEPKAALVRRLTVTFSSPRLRQNQPWLPSKAASSTPSSLAAPRPFS